MNAETMAGLAISRLGWAGAAGSPGAPSAKRVTIRSISLEGMEVSRRRTAIEACPRQ